MDNERPQEISVTPEAISEAIDKVASLARGVRERSPLHHYEMDDAKTWAMASSERAAALLYVATHCMAFADEEMAGSVFGAVRRKFVD